jgi:hypothetical protein
MTQPHSSFVGLCKSVIAIGLLALVIIACRSTNQSTASWAKAKVLSDNEDHPSKIVTDGEAVYFVTGGTVASQQEGTNNIKKISLADGSVSVFVRGGQIIPGYDPGDRRQICLLVGWRKSSAGAENRRDEREDHSKCAQA